MILQTEPFVIEREFDYPVSLEAKERMSFQERYEGFCVDLIKVRGRRVLKDGINTFHIHRLLMAV